MFSSATLLGRVGKKETKTLKNGNEMTILSVATHKIFKDSEGEKKEQTTWHRVSCFGKVQEIAYAFAQVGDLIFIRGEIQHQQVQSGDKIGQFMYSLNANEIRIPRSKKDEPTQPSRVSNSPKKPINDYMLLDDDVPF